MKQKMITKTNMQCRGSFWNGSADYVHGEMWNRNIAVVDRHLDRGKCMHTLS